MESISQMKSFVFHLSLENDLHYEYQNASGKLTELEEIYFFIENLTPTIDSPIHITK